MNEKYTREILALIFLFFTLQCGQCHMNEAKMRTGRVVSRLYRLQLINMLNIIDEDADPCEDFFAHACGNYAEAMNEKLHLSGELTFYTDPIVPPYLYNYEDRMYFFENNKAHFVTSSGRLLSNLYTSCKHRMRTDYELRSPLRRWYRILKGIAFLAKNSRLYMKWPLMRHEWQELERQHVYLDWMQLAAKFAAHGVVNFVRVFFAEGTIYIAPVRAGEDVYCHSLDEWQTKLLTFRLKYGRQDVEIIANELRTFCRELIGELSFNPELHPEKDTRKYIKRAEINNSFLYNMSSEYFQLYFGSLELSEEQLVAARVIHVETERLNDTAALIQSTHPSILFNFVLWQAYEKLRYDDCFLLTEEFEDMLLSEYWNWDVFNAHFSRKSTLGMYMYHTTRFQEQRRASIMGEQWDRFLYAKLQRTDFNLPRLLSTYAKTQFDPVNLTIIYGTDKFIKGDFYENLLHFRRRKSRNTFLSAFVDADDFNHPLYFLRHFLHFTILLLQRPLFHYFATLGFELWHKSDVLYNSDGYYTSLDCLERQSLLNFENSSIYQLLDETQVSEVFRFYRAFLETLRDYNFWLEGESFAFAEDFVLEHFHLTSKRVLFYAVTQLYCGRNDNWYASLINKSFMNMPQFETVFECKMEASMNPLVKCMINRCG